MPCISQGTINSAMSYNGEVSVFVLCTSHFQDSKDGKGSSIFHFQNTPEQCDVFCLQVVLHEPGKRAVFPLWSPNGVSRGGDQSATLQDRPLGLMGSLLGSYEVMKHLGSRSGAQQFGAGLQISRSMVECQAVKANQWSRVIIMAVVRALQGRRKACWSGAAVSVPRVCLELGVSVIYADLLIIF